MVKQGTGAQLPTSAVSFNLTAPQGGLEFPPRQVKPGDGLLCLHLRNDAAERDRACGTLNLGPGHGGMHGDLHVSPSICEVTLSGKIGLCRHNS